MKEIGGYMEFETYSGKEYYDDLVSLNVARNAIRYLYKTKKIKKVYLPFYLGWSIFDLFHDMNWDYECYHIKEDWLPDLEKTMEEGEVIFIVNYFGQLSNEKIEKLQQYYGNIMIDSTQSFFQRPVKGVDTFYTCHKYFGVTDGAYLSTDQRLEEKLETDTSYERFLYLTGRYEVGAQKFYELCKKTDDGLRYLELKEMSKLTKNILRSLDYKTIEEKRRKNFEFLDKQLSKYNKLKKLRVGTFMYPFWIENGSEVRKYLIQNKIYIPLYWKNVIGTVEEDSLENDFIYNLLPIPMDHRYTIEDMKRVVEVIDKGMNIK